MPAAGPRAQPSILLITLDTTRADRLGSYGYAAAATPHLDRLARDGVRFARGAFAGPADAPGACQPADRPQPFSHGVRNNGHFVLPADLPTLATAFAGRGYDTAAFVSSFVLDRQFGLDRGFAHYDDGLDQPPSARRSRSSWNGAATGPWRPLFVAGRARLALTVDAVLPVGAPLRRARAICRAVTVPRAVRGRPYDGEIAFQDALVGRLLDAVSYGTSAAPLVAVAGDHGESLGEHGESTHGLFVYDAALRVPLMIAWPGTLVPSVVPSPVRLVDLAPTLADLAGVEFAGAEGESLRPRLGSARGDEAPPVYAETYFPQFFMQWAPLRAVEAGRWKYIDAPEPELYDLRADPGEQTNLASAEPARVTSLQRALEGMTGAGAGRVAATPLTEDARRRLASLGYLSGSTPEPAIARPAARSQAHGRSLRGAARRQPRAGERSRRRRAGHRAPGDREDPGNGFARLVLGRACLATGRNQDAVAAFKAYLELVPGSADAHHWMALAHLRLGDRARALAEEEATLAIDPRHTAALSLKAGLLFSSGRRDEGLQACATAWRATPRMCRFALELADLLTDAGRSPMRKASIGPSSPRGQTMAARSWAWGSCWAPTGRTEAALDSFSGRRRRPPQRRSPIRARRSAGEVGADRCRALGLRMGRARGDAAGPSKGGRLIRWTR